MYIYIYIYKAPVNLDWATSYEYRSGTLLMKIILFLVTTLTFLLCNIIFVIFTS